MLQISPEPVRCFGTGRCTAANRALTGGIRGGCRIGARTFLVRTFLVRAVLVRAVLVRDVTFRDVTVRSAVFGATGVGDVMVDRAGTRRRGRRVGGCGSLIGRGLVCHADILRRRVPLRYRG